MNTNHPLKKKTVGSTPALKGRWFHGGCWMAIEFQGPQNGWLVFLKPTFVAWICSKCMEKDLLSQIIVLMVIYHGTKEENTP